MKISPALYQSMLADISEICRKLGITSAGEKPMSMMWALLGEVSYQRAYDDKRPDFADGRKARLLPYDGRPFCFYYSDGCNDAHIATALRKLPRELSL